MEYTFLISGYGDDSLEEDVALALSRRVEEEARAKYIGLMRTTDRLNAYTAKGPGRDKRIVRYRIYGVLLLVMGIFLLVPGLMEPGGLTGPLVVGAFSVLLGLFNLFLPRKRREPGPSEAFYRSAGRLLEKLRSTDWSLPENHTQVRFDEAGMAVVTSQETVRTPWTDIYGVYETQRLWLLVYGEEKVLVLQREDLTAGEPEAFAPWLRERMDGNDQ